MDDVFDAYKSAASRLIARFEEISSEQLYQPVIDLMPTAPSRAVDIGAGTGRDADWLAAQGHSVLAVEPVAEFREAGRARHPSPKTSPGSKTIYPIWRKRKRGVRSTC